MMVIEVMTDADWLEVAGIYQAGMDSNLATFQTICPSFEEWDKGHLRNCRLTIRQNGNIAGWGALSPVSSRPVYAGVCEVSIYVAPDRQGKGVGKTLMAALIECSVENGIWTLQSSIMSDNTASLALHEKCGFRQVGYREQIGRDRHGVWRDTVLMERREPSIK